MGEWVNGPLPHCPSHTHRLRRIAFRYRSQLDGRRRCSIRSASDGDGKRFRLAERHRSQRIWNRGLPPLPLDGHREPVDIRARVGAHVSRMRGRWQLSSLARIGQRERRDRGLAGTELTLRAARRAEHLESADPRRRATGRRACTTGSRARRAARRSRRTAAGSARPSTRTGCRSSGRRGTARR